VQDTHFNNNVIPNMCIVIIRIHLFGNQFRIPTRFYRMCLYSRLECPDEFNLIQPLNSLLADTLKVAKKDEIVASILVNSSYNDSHNYFI
jgi:hypothetical protein